MENLGAAHQASGPRYEPTVIRIGSNTANNLTTTYVNLVQNCDYSRCCCTT